MAKRIPNTPSDDVVHTNRGTFLRRRTPGAAQPYRWTVIAANGSDKLAHGGEAYARLIDADQGAYRTMCILAGALGYRVVRKHKVPPTVTAVLKKVLTAVKAKHAKATAAPKVTRKPKAKAPRTAGTRKK